MTANLPCTFTYIPLYNVYCETLITGPINYLNTNVKCITVSSIYFIEVSTYSYNSENTDDKYSTYSLSPKRELKLVKIYLGENHSNLVFSQIEYSRW